MQLNNAEAMQQCMNAISLQRLISTRRTKTTTSLVLNNSRLDSILDPYSTLISISTFGWSTCYNIHGIPHITLEAYPSHHMNTPSNKHKSHIAEKHHFRQTAKLRVRATLSCSACPWAQPTSHDKRMSEVNPSHITHDAPRWSAIMSSPQVIALRYGIKLDHRTQPSCMFYSHRVDNST